MIIAEPKFGQIGALMIFGDQLRRQMAVIIKNRLTRRNVRPPSIVCLG